jgi:hypothetical protein
MFKSAFLVELRHIAPSLVVECYPELADHNARNQVHMGVSTQVFCATQVFEVVPENRTGS